MNVKIKWTSFNYLRDPEATFKHSENSYTDYSENSQQAISVHGQFSNTDESTQREQER